MRLAMLAVDVVSPAGRPLAEGDRPALVVAGTPQIRTGDQLVFVKVVAVAPAVVRRDAQVQAGGHLAAPARLGTLEQQLDELAGPGLIEEIAAHATLAGQVKGEARRAMTAAFAIRATVLMARQPDADYSEVMAALAGDRALVPGSARSGPARQVALTVHGIGADGQSIKDFEKDLRNNLCKREATAERSHPNKAKTQLGAR